MIGEMGSHLSQSGTVVLRCVRRRRGHARRNSDNGMPTGGLDQYWETPETLNETWGYSRFDRSGKESRTVMVDQLADTLGANVASMEPRPCSP